MSENQPLLSEPAKTVVPPKLRGWFHLGATPAVVIASLVLFILSKESLKFAVALYSITAIMLFSVSAIYHRVALLEPHDRNLMLAIVWTGALAGVAIRVFWIGAPRWLYVANYLVLGWVAIVYTPQLYDRGGLWVLIPILIGGLLYSIGAIFYALKRPGREAKYFGFHELFHIFVLAAWISQYLAICFAIYRSRCVKQGRV